jgi:hypothetical protein
MQMTLDTISHTLQAKLQGLVSFLTQANRGFDNIAEEIDCANLRSALTAIAIECKQYAKEIRDQLKQASVELPVEYTDQEWKQIEETVNGQSTRVRGGEIAALCNNCEIYFTTLYEDILKEYFPYKNLNAIISYQLYATRCAFMKIRLLNALRFDQQVN